VPAACAPPGGPGSWDANFIARGDFSARLVRNQCAERQESGRGDTHRQLSPTTRKPAVSDLSGTRDPDRRFEPVSAKPTSRNGSPTAMTQWISETARFVVNAAVMVVSARSTPLLRKSPINGIGVSSTHPFSRTHRESTDKCRQDTRKSSVFRPPLPSRRTVALVALVRFYRFPLAGFCASRHRSVAVRVGDLNGLGEGGPL
jgi:hypothetical protein